LPELQDIPTAEKIRCRLVYFHRAWASCGNKLAEVAKPCRARQDTFGAGPDPWRVILVVNVARIGYGARRYWVHDFPIREPVSVVVYFLDGALLLDLPRLARFH